MARDAMLFVTSASSGSASHPSGTVGTRATTSAVNPDRLSTVSSSGRAVIRDQRGAEDEERADEHVSHRGVVVGADRSEPAAGRHALPDH
jgi:hypothetical protein